MEVGVAVPERLIGFDPAVLRDFAVHAEELGFSYLTATDLRPRSYSRRPQSAVPVRRGRPWWQSRRRR